MRQATLTYITLLMASPALVTLADDHLDALARENVELQRTVAANDALIERLTASVEGNGQQALRSEIDSLSSALADLQAQSRAKWGEKQRRDSLGAINAEIAKLERRITKSRDELVKRQRRVNELTYTLDWLHGRDTAAVEEADTIVISLDDEAPLNQ